MGRNNNHVFNHVNHISVGSLVEDICVFVCVCVCTALKDVYVHIIMHLFALDASENSPVLL